MNQPQAIGKSSIQSHKARSVRTIAMLNGLQGGFELVVALVIFYLGSYVPALLELRDFVNDFDGIDSDNSGSGNPLTGPYGFWAYIICGLALLVFVGGCLRIVAALQNRRFRGRTLGIVSLSAGLSSIITIICMPTAVALLIWGLIIYFDPSVKAAFDK